MKTSCDPLSDQSALAARRIQEIIHAASMATGLNLSGGKSDRKNITRVFDPMQAGRLIVCVRNGNHLQWDIR